VSGQLTITGIMVGANDEARAAEREDAEPRNINMMSSDDVRRTMTTGEGVGPPVQPYGETGRRVFKGAGEAGVKGSGDTGRSHDMRVWAAPAGTKGVQGGAADWAS
jgi:hypothetical protein